ncbi:MAG: type VI secretion system baseplate subunit TssG, partial [Geobacteraceae bacterium]|nr:type VI secretion system baseplate subunit TssG [Geobacteraceae bacterium]
MVHPSEMTTLIGELLEKGHEFSFVQVMRLARRYLDPEGEAGIPGIPWQERVTIRPELSLAFPASDVAKVERNGDNLRITATFLGLYGPSSPLPAFYTEDLMDEASNDESVFRDFLDIIHQRLYHLYFACWSKYRLLIRIVEENNPIDRERLLCLIGLGEKELSESIPDSYNLLRYTGILTQHPRSATGLAAMLRDMLGMKDLRIMQNVKRMVPIPADQRMRLGLGNCRLGIDTVLGSQIADRMGKFRIRIGPLTWREFNDHLPGTARHEKLTRYTRFYLTDPLEVEVELVLAAGEARPIVLGDPEARLGLNTWCFSGDSLGEVSAVFRMAAMPGIRTPRKSGRAPRQSRTFIDHYREERAALDKLAAQYVEEHPNLAPMMSGPLADQGVERLFEGTAFLNALLRQKLEDDIPEF